MILPIRDFSGMTRLASVLTAEERRTLTRELCERALRAVHGADLRALVVSSSHDVLEWAGNRGLDSIPDPGRGLSQAAAASVAGLDGSPWVVLHADLPLVTPSVLRRVAEFARDRTVLVPSHDGGTNVIASQGAFPFAYGSGSFHRHFASAPNAVVMASAHLSIDIDSPTQLAAFPGLTSTGRVDT